MSAVRFFDDDSGYVIWRSTHEEGLVLNCAPVPQHNYLMLHKASCRTLRALRADYSSWTHHYVKVCANSREEIDRWIADNVPGGVARRCQACIDRAG